MPDEIINAVIELLIYATGTVVVAASLIVVICWALAVIVRAIKRLIQ